MAALSTCLRRHRKALADADVDVAALKARVEELKVDGEAPKVAALSAVEELIGEAEQARTELAEKIQAQGGKAPDVPVAPAAPAADEGVAEQAPPERAGAAERKPRGQPEGVARDDKGAPPTVPAGKRPAGYGTKNKVVSKEDYAEVQRKLREKLGRVSAGIDPEVALLGAQAAAYHIEAGARTFVDYAKAMVEDFGNAVRPYLQSWYMAAKYNPELGEDVRAEMDSPETVESAAATLEEDRGRDAPSTAPYLERDRQPGEQGSELGLGQENIPQAGGLDGADSGVDREEDGEPGDQPPGDQLGDADGAVAGGAKSHPDLFATDRPDGSETSAAGPGDGRGSSTAGADGIPVDSRPEAGPGSSLAQRVEQQTLAESIPVRDGAENIRGTLPVLLPAQQEDVAKAETRFESGKGMLFTNGTGTGKTFSGLGIIKRAHRRGAKNILVVVPTDAIAQGWKSSAQNLLLDIYQLKDTRDNGEGRDIVVTTYANFYQNQDLKLRDWDLITLDESQYLNQDQAGAPTEAERMFKALGRHPNYVSELTRWRDDEYRATWRRQESDFKKEVARALKRQNRSSLGKAARREIWEGVAQKYTGKFQAIETRLNAEGTLRGPSNPLASRDGPKVVFLSATPFAYHFSLTYADDFLFDLTGAWKPDDQYGGYNQGDTRDQFYMTNFGYRMRTNKLTQPESGVDVGLMEREFAEKLKREGVMSGRTLDVSFDYSRDFVQVHSSIGETFDAGVRAAYGYDPETGERLKTTAWPQLQEIARKKYTYLYLAQLFEGAKAQEAVGRIQEHLAMGRQVVVFHQYNHAAPVHPFNFRERQSSANVDAQGNVEIEVEPVPLSADESAQIDAFHSAYPQYRALDLSSLTNVPSAMSTAFGDDAVIFNGTVSKSDRRKNIARFNEGKARVIVVQMDAGREGISLHDVVGNAPRVVMNLGLPVKPPVAIQTEGRAYRVGQASDAIFEYPVLRTSMEQFMFGSQISSRVKTVENLAMGEGARDLETSFREGYSNATDAAPNAEQGKGGREADAAGEKTTEYQKAKTYYYSRQKRTARTKAREGKDYFATPEPLGLKMVQWAGLRPNDRALEPSAGHGAIARFLPGDTTNVLIEPSFELAAQLNVNAGASRVENSTFENHHVVNKYDAVVMNPPFGSGGKLAMDHLVKAAKHVRNRGGRIVAIVPDGPAFDKRWDKEYESAGLEGAPVPGLADFVLVAEISLPTVTFGRAGTAAKTKLVVLDRQVRGASYERIVPGIRIDIKAETAEELFDALEHIEVRGVDRTNVVEVYEDTEGLPIRITAEESGYKVALLDATGRELAYPIRAFDDENLEGARAYAKRLAEKGVDQKKPGVLRTVPGIEGTEIQIIANDSGYAVAMRDTDADQLLPTLRIYKTLAEAEDYVEGIVAKTPSAVTLEAAELSVDQGMLKGGGEGWVVSGKGTFKHRALLKSLKGKWNNATLSWGFQEDPTEKLSEALRPKFSVSPQGGVEAITIPGAIRAGAGFSVSRVEEAIAPVRRRWKNAPPIKVVPNVDSLPDAVRAQLPGGEPVEGVYWRGTVYLVADQIGSARRARQVLAHEAIGHHSMEEMLGSQFAGVLEQVETLRQAGLIDDVVEAVTQRYGEFDAAEAIAVIAELRPAETRVRALMRTVREAARKFLNRLGIADLFTRADLDALISQAGRRLRDAGAETGLPQAADAGAFFSREEGLYLGGERGTQQRERQGQEPLRTSEGGDPKDGWREATRIVRSGAPGRVFRGAREALSAPNFQELGASTLHPSSGLGVFFSDSRTDATRYGPVVEEFYLDVRNPLVVKAEDMPAFDSVEVAQAYAADLKDRGHDGLVITAKHLGGPVHVVAFEPSQVLQEEARFSRRRREYTPEQQAALEKGKFGDRGPPVPPRERWGRARDNLKTKLRQGMVDQFDSFRTVLGDSRAWMMAQLTSSSTGALDATLRYGAPALVDNAIAIRPDTKGLREVFAPLEGEIDDFLRWVAGHRADRLVLEGKEKLFDQADIDALKTLNQGEMSDGRSRAEVYESVRGDFEGLSAAVVSVAVDTGLVNAEEAQEWRDEGFYVPFYRMMEESASGPRTFGSSGLVRQNAYKKLTGADIPLDDLLTNVLLNWQHLLGASLKNQAAVKALETAQVMGLATPKTARTKSTKAVFVRVDGEQVWYDLESSTEAQLVLQALSALSFDGLNSFSMRVLRKFKRALTVGVTANPAFKVRNLMRDSIQAVAVSGVSANVASNLYTGWRATVRGSPSEVAMLAGGGSFGQSGYIHGADPDAVKYLVSKGIDRGTILTSPTSVLRVLQRVSGWDAYQDFGARLENVNRAADFEIALKEGADLLEANFRARDHVDFSRTGAWTAVRALAQVVPFLNARLQGLDKLLRAGADPKQKARFFATVGLYSLASSLLYLMMKDDDDYKAAEDWERDAYHLFKLPGSDILYRLPRPFEVGAIATLVERGLEQLVDEDVHGALFAERVGHALWQTLQFNPVPQAFMPVAELYANKDTFTGRPIESLNMRNMRPQDRKRAWTGQTAIAASSAMAAISWDKVVLSPVQVEHLVQGYFGWLGATTLGGADMVWRMATDGPQPPSRRIDRVPLVGDFARGTPRYSTRYTTELYKMLREVNQIAGSIREYRKGGNVEAAAELVESARDKLNNRKMLNRASRALSGIREQIRKTRVSRDIEPDEKRAAIDQLIARRNQLSRRVVERAKQTRSP